MILKDRNGSELLKLEVHNLDSTYNTPPNRHHKLELSCVLKGTGRYIIEDRVYDLRPGDVIILNNIERHAIRIDNGSSFSHIVVHFDPSFIWNSLSNDIDYNFLLIFYERSPNFSNRLDRDNPATARIFSLILEMKEEIETQRLCYELIVKIKLQTIFSEIIRNYDYIDRDNVIKPLSGNDIYNLNNVINYINDNLDSELKLNDLANLVHLSPTYFSVLFKRYNGLSPFEYIIHKRVQRAIELIRTTDMNLTEIAMACGFNNSTNFYKTFKKITGNTPAFYRCK